MSSKQELQSIYNILINNSPICSDLIDVICKYIDVRPQCDTCFLKCDSKGILLWIWNETYEYTSKRYCDKCYITNFSADAA
jgi:hypothetical protein